MWYILFYKHRHSETEIDWYKVKEEAATKHQPVLKIRSLFLSYLLSIYIYRQYV